MKLAVFDLDHTLLPIDSGDLWSHWIVEKAGLDGKGLSTHKLRHTAATLLYQDAGVDIRVLKELLGHESLSTTEIYTHVSNKQIEEASKKSPLGNVKPRKDR